MIVAFIVLLVIAVALGGYIVYGMVVGKRKAETAASAVSETREKETSAEQEKADACDGEEITENADAE